MTVVGDPITGDSSPITLAVAKAHLRVDHSDEDTLITNLISAATQYAQKRTKRRFINGTVTEKFDEFPSDYIELDLSPLSSVTSVTYIDNDGNSQTWSSSLYTVDTTNEPGRIFPVYGESWPTTRSQPLAVTVTYVAGYGADAASTPEAIRQALLLIIAAWYENREEESAGLVVRQIPLGAKALLGMYEIMELQ